MKTVGIICEYNPFHRGHLKQFHIIRQLLGDDTAIVCLMSGNFVQRSAPAIVDKSLRAKAAVLCGADLVIELPVTYALSSAEGFAAGGVEILGKFCDYLCFGCETGNPDTLMDTAKVLLSADFSPLLRSQLEKGLSFPAARAAALAEMGLNSDILTQPNDILAVEYCKAMISQNTRMQPLPILREGSYHAQEADAENPSATAVRSLMVSGHNWKSCVPKQAQAVFTAAPLHTVAAGQRAMLGKLRTMTEAEFAAIPYGSEGLWRKFMHACREYSTLEEILTAVKSKRYTRTRIDRMAMCAYLGITEEMLSSPAPYARVLAFNDTGRTILKNAKKVTSLINAGEAVDSPYWELEKRCGDLYGLFRIDGIDPPGSEENRRVYYHKENP